MRASRSTAIRSILDEVEKLKLDTKDPKAAKLVRVIQRVGRINRIGKKVFDNLYIFNFFPTLKGSTIVANRAIAENKMFAIHQILGEDAKIFSIHEEPTPAGLYSKVSSFGEEEMMSFYTEAKIKHQKARTFLEKNHPEVLERIGGYPNPSHSWQRLSCAGQA